MEMLTGYTVASYEQLIKNDKWARIWRGGGGSGLLQIKYFGIRLRALRKKMYTGARMQEDILYILGKITKSFSGLRRSNPSCTHH